MIKQEEVYRIGKIGKPHGVKGEVTLFFDDDVFDRVDADYLVLAIDGILVPFYLEEWRFKTGETALVKFCDIDTKEQASALTGSGVFFPKHLSDRGEDELVAVDESTMNVLFEVETPSGSIVLVPANEDIVKEVNTKERLIKVDLPEGLVDLNDNE